MPDAKQKIEAAIENVLEKPEPRAMGLFCPAHAPHAKFMLQVLACADTQEKKEKIAEVFARQLHEQIREISTILSPLSPPA